MFDFLTVGKAESFGFSAENPTGVRGEPNHKKRTIDKIPPDVGK